MAVLVRLHDDPDLKLFNLIGSDRSFRLLLGPPGLIVSVESSSLLLHSNLT